MNLPPVGEETFLICMALSVVTGALLGFALGYAIREKRHADEIASVIRIAKRVSMAQATNKPQVEKERAPKGPLKIIPKDQLFV